MSDADRIAGATGRREAETETEDRRIAEAEARGYARGVEDAAKAVMREGFGGTPCYVSVRALLKPKGEAK
jgi:hypothetical protein